MTVTEMLAEITSRCGEGYENYVTRAKAIFNASVKELIANFGNNMEAITGLIYTGEYTVTEDKIYVTVDTLIQSAGFSTGILRYMDYTSPPGVSEHDKTPLEQATPSQERAISLNSNLANAVGSVIFFRYNSQSSEENNSPCITLLNGAEFAEAGVIAFTAIGWSDTYLDTGANVITTMFSPIALENLIRVSVEKLRQEIAA